MSEINSATPYALDEPVCSTDSVWYKDYEDKSLSDHLDEMETEIDGKAASGHTHDGYAASEHTHTGYAAANHEHSEYAPASHEHSGYAASGHTHSDLAPASHVHEGYSPTGHTHSDLAAANHEHSGYAASEHSHNVNDVTNLSALLLTALNGDVKENISGLDVLATIAAKAAGIYTFYADTTSVNNPNTSSGWRYLVHKTGLNYGWLFGFASDGTVVSNYMHGANNWAGWRYLHDANPAALWTGAKLMASTETITPSKPLSECRNGWMLEWSDYNNDSASQANTNFVQTPIFKRNVNGAWDGKNMMFRVPNYISDDAATVGNATKQLIVYDTKLVGHVANNQGSANLDVCLRAVYEF